MDEDDGEVPDFGELGEAALTDAGEDADADAGLDDEDAATPSDEEGSDAESLDEDDDGGDGDGDAAPRGRPGALPGRPSWGEAARVAVVPPEMHRTPPAIGLNELARLVATRAATIASGDIPPLLPAVELPRNGDAATIALRELAAGLCPLRLRRPAGFAPDGTEVVEEVDPNTCSLPPETAEKLEYFREFDAANPLVP